LIVFVALFSARFALFLMWLFTDRLSAAFDSTIGPLLGFFFLPWTTLMYTIVWSTGGVHGANWIAVAFGAFLDLLSYSGRKAQQMRRSAAY
ncbi:MAG: hypothetical protein ACXVRQ_06780, partial [Gaiellaceae bacterium]